MSNRLKSVLLAAVLTSLLGVSCGRKAKTSCIANLRMIDGAKESWATEHASTNGTMVLMSELMVYFKDIPKCPAGGNYVVGTVGEDPECTFAEHAGYKILPNPSE